MIIRIVPTEDIAPVNATQERLVAVDTNGIGWKKLSEPRLKYKVSYAADCHDLDEFVNFYLEEYGLTWKALDTGDDGYHNGSYMSADVRVGQEIEDDLDQDFDRWLQGEYFYAPEDGDIRYWDERPGIQHILQWLCNRALIPEGNYVVELWW